MANQKHLSILRQGAAAWNDWRRQNPTAKPNLSKADLTEIDFVGGTDFGADLTKTNMRECNLSFVNLGGVDLSESTLTGADLTWANLTTAHLFDTDLRFARLFGANLMDASLTRADMTGADLTHAIFSGTGLQGAKLNDCIVYGVSVWDVDLENAEQSNLVITIGEPSVTVDNLEVAQFIYLLLKSQRIRHVIDTITSKAVLILGRFTERRKAVLNAIRDELRQLDYLPILFDFDVPQDRDITETVTLLARMSRFIIADITEPSSIPKELEAIVPTLAVPVQPLIEGNDRPYAMFNDYWKYDWVLDVHRYENPTELIAKIRKHVIIPAEGKVEELLRRRQEARS
jgi:hypothetical protein